MDFFDKILPIWCGILEKSSIFLVLVGCFCWQCILEAILYQEEESETMRRCLCNGLPPPSSSIAVGGRPPMNN